MHFEKMHRSGAGAKRAAVACLSRVQRYLHGDRIIIIIIALLLLEMRLQSSQLLPHVAAAAYNKPTAGVQWR